MTTAKPPASALSPGELRIELAIEGLHSIVSGGFLALSQATGRIETTLDRIAVAIERQTEIMSRSNGHSHDAEPLSSTT